MRILRITSQNRRDMHCDMVCEHCGNIEKNVYCYDDTNFHENVIPKMVCKKCGKTASDDYRPIKTKYPDSQIV